MGAAIRRTNYVSEVETVIPHPKSEEERELANDLICCADGMVPRIKKPSEAQLSQNTQVAEHTRESAGSAGHMGRGERSGLPRTCPHTSQVWLLPVSSVIAVKCFPEFLKLL